MRRQFLFTMALIVTFAIFIPSSSFLSHAFRQEVVGGFDVQRLRAKSRSRISLTKGGQLVEVFLFAEDEEMEVLDSPYCGGDTGDKKYRGNYQLISVLNNGLVSSTIKLGDYEFIEGRIYGGIQEFRVHGTIEVLISIYQYRGCNGNGVEFYRVDKDGSLNKVLFIGKDGRKEDSQYTSDDLSNSANEVTICGYSNSVGHEFCDSYAYDGKDFIQVAGWMTHQLYQSKRTPEGEAKRALFDFLMNLHHGNYELAVSYYGGPYDALRSYNSDVDSNNRSKLLERYCTVNGGVCLLPEELASKDLGGSDEIKFVVSFMFDFVDVAGKSRFDFRVKRIGNEFKVLDLPPRSPR